MGVSAFITGTDTDVGKTYVTRLILETLRGDGIDAVGYKPVACGNRADATILAAASGNLPRDEVNPVFLKPALAPLVAAMLENRSLTLAELVAGYQHLAARHGRIVRHAALANACGAGWGGGGEVVRSQKKGTTGT